MRPRKPDEVNTTNFIKRKPKKNVVQEAINNAALCGLKTIRPISTFSWVNINFTKMKYNVSPKIVLPPPHAAYLNVCKGMSRLNEG